MNLYISIRLHFLIIMMFYIVCVCVCVRYLVVLSEEGTVSVVCGVTGLTLSEGTTEGNTEGLPVLDMKLLQEVEDQAQLLFFHQDTHSGEHLLRIVSYPGKWILRLPRDFLFYFFNLIIIIIIIFFFLLIYLFSSLLFY